MKTIKIVTSKKEIVLVIPESWEEVTVQMFIRLEKEGWDNADIIHILSILSGESLRELDNIKDLTLFDTISDYLGFITVKPPDFEGLAISNKFTIDGKEFDVPQDLELETLGQKILVASLVQGNIVKAIPEALAIYFQPIFDGTDFNRRRIPALVHKINKTPIMEAYPIVSFFFQKLAGFRISGKLSSPEYQKPVDS